MKKRHRIIASALAFSLLLCQGCGAKGGNENITAGMEAIEALDYDTALASFAAAGEAGEDPRLRYRGEGIAYLGKTQYADASAAFEMALANSSGRVDGMDFDINYYLATAYYRQEALADFDKTVSLNTRDYDRLISIYCVLEEYGYRESGQAYLQSAMESGTKYMTNFEKGRISYYLEDYENARNYLEKARDENGYEAALFLGRTYETLGDFNYAVSVYNTFLDGGEENAQILNQLGLCKMQMRDYGGALEAFQRAIQIEDSGMLQVLKMNEIVAYENLRDFEKAASLLESYLKTYPDDTTAKREYEFLKTR